MKIGVTRCRPDLWLLYNLGALRPIISVIKAENQAAEQPDSTKEKKANRK